MHLEKIRQIEEDSPEKYFYEDIKPNDLKNGLVEI